MKTKYILTLATILILISCGKSEKEIRIEKEKIEIEKKKNEFLFKTVLNKNKIVDLIYI